ncbi:hypothetical protein [Staphylospora marina]|uniref:hypothetical protein n=1 Tax=Staphylospora marina TaxID=2490858 RepID=UPI000F5BC3FC|nr:hypothetical protein [Staphylospora marina]
MKRLNTSQLLKEISPYDWFSWNGEEGKPCPHRICFTMPEEQFNRKINVASPLYWGFEAVNNKSADPTFTPREWIAWEQAFFDWLETAGEFLFPSGNTVVSPDLSREWRVDAYLAPGWKEEHPRFEEWFGPACQAYEDLLAGARIISRGPAEWDDARAAAVESWAEVRLLGQASIKGVPLLFFCGGKWVASITEYLTVQVSARDGETLRQLKEELGERLDPRFL